MAARSVAGGRRCRTCRPPTNPGTDVRDPEFADLYGPRSARRSDRRRRSWRTGWRGTVELVEHNDPQLVWFDWWIEQDVFKPWLAPVRRLVLQPAARTPHRPVAINYKFDAFPPGISGLRRRARQIAGIRPMLWQNDTSVRASRGAGSRPASTRTSRVILGDLMDVVSKNGALLLNVGPKPDGSSRTGGARCCSRDR